MTMTVSGKGRERCEDAHDWLWHGGRGQEQGMHTALESREGEKTDSPLKLQEGTQPY